MLKDYYDGSSSATEAALKRRRDKLANTKGLNKNDSDPESDKISDQLAEED